MIEIQKITDVMQHLNGLKVVVFDLDDTLYSEKEYVKSGYYAVSQILPQVYDAEAKLWKAFEEKKSAIDELLNAEGIYNEELKQRCLEVYRFHKPNIHLYDGAEKMLTYLREQGRLIGILTDGRPEGQWAKIKAFNLINYVDHTIVTDELGGVEYRKPNEKAFRLMKEQFGVEFSEMCYVGDNIRKDFIAPEKLGIRPIWFRNTEGLYC
ncbi:HAD family hydrolase [Hungatella hathewayi]